MRFLLYLHFIFDLHVDVLHFIFDVLLSFIDVFYFVVVSSFVVVFILLLFIHIFFSTSSLTLPWTIAGIFTFHFLLSAQLIAD